MKLFIQTIVIQASDFVPNFILELQNLPSIL